MATTDPITPERRRFSICLPRPLWIGMAAAVLVVLAVGSRFGVPIYRQQVAIWEIERLDGFVETIDCGPQWLRRLFGDEPLAAFDDVYSMFFDEVYSVTIAGQ